MSTTKLVTVPPRCEASVITQSDVYYDPEPLRIPQKKKVGFFSVIRTLFLIFCVVAAFLFVYGKYKPEIVAFVAPSPSVAAPQVAEPAPAPTVQKVRPAPKQVAGKEAETPMLDTLMDKLNNLLRN